MLVCKYCGSTSIMADAWVDVNTGEVINTFDNWFCNGCNQETTPIEIEEFNDNQCRCKEP